MSTDTPTPSSEIKARATRLLARFPSELAKAVYVAEKIGYVALPGDLPKKRKELEDSNPLLRPRTKPLHLGAVTLSRPNAKHKAALEGSDLEFVVVVKECVWSLMTEAGRDGALFDVLLVGFTAPPSAFGHHLAVENDELVARAGTSVRRGGQLIGAVLLVALPGGVTVPVTIAGHQQVPSWAEGRAPIAAYTLVYPEPMEISGVKNVCAGDPLDPVANVVTVLGGERYDEATKTVVPGSRWFTLACPGSAAAKLSLLGYGPQSSATTVAQRQATLKMITADYCGAGTSYTQNGTPLQWANRDGSVSPASDALGPVEAVWSAHGALCLEATRIAGAQAACSLPSCAGFDLDDGEWITHVP